MRSDEHAVELRVGRRRFHAAGQNLELAPAHEARAGDRIAERADIRERVALRIELFDVAADREEDHPGAGRDDRERRLSLLHMRQQRRAGIVDAALDRDVLGPSPSFFASAGRTGPSGRRPGAAAPRIFAIPSAPPCSTT